MQTVIKPLPKGQITIPVSFRKALNISADTLFRAELTNKGILLTPIQLDWKEKYVREFSDREITKWLKDDTLDAKTRAKVKKYLT